MNYVDVTMRIYFEDGQELGDTTRRAISASVKGAIDNRLFGAGFLPDDVEVDTYYLKFEWNIEGGPFWRFTFDKKDGVPDWSTLKGEDL